MALPIWPTSPVPASIQRDPLWGESVQVFDNGKEVGGSPWQKPLIKYTVSLQNIPMSKQQSLWFFYNRLCRGRSVPFLFADPYENRVDGVVCINTGSIVQSFFIRSSEGYPVLPASGTLTIRKMPANTVSPFSIDWETGIVNFSAETNVADYYVASCHYFKKCKWDSWSESSQVWGIFSGTASFHEIAIP